VAAVTEEDRHRAPALWVVVGALVAAILVAWFVGALEGLLLLVMTLGGAAVARLLGGGRRPEGVAVRSTWQDVTVLLALALAIVLLAVTPGVASSGGDRRSSVPQERASSWSVTSISSSTTSSSSSSGSSSSPSGS
jgi:hypothetical protein